MQILGCVACAAMGVVAGIWLAAGDGTVDQTTSAVIPRQPADVFPFLIDPLNLKKWLDGFVSSEAQLE